MLQQVLRASLHVLEANLASGMKMTWLALTDVMLTVCH